MSGDEADDALEVPTHRWPLVGAAVLVGLLALGLGVVLLASDGSSASSELDAGIDAHRPMVIGEPVFIARSSVVPVDDDTLARAEAEDRAATASSSREPRSPERARSRTGEPSDPTASSGTANPSPRPTSPGPMTPSTGRTITAADGPAARLAAAAYRGEAQRVIQQRYLSDVQDCFNRATRADPTLDGQVTLGFIPADDGHVMSSRAVRDTIGGGVGTCVAAAARAWQLPPPPPNALEMRMTFSL